MQTLAGQMKRSDHGVTRHKARREVRNQIPEKLGKWDRRANTTKKDWEEPLDRLEVGI